MQADFPTEEMCSRFDDEGNQLPGHNDKWLCFKCKCEVCINCYMKHNAKAHPEIYSASCKNCKSMTFVEDFVDYEWCKKCASTRDVNT